MHTDLLGRTIRHGDLLAYPVRTGSTTYLCVIRVDDILWNGIVGNIVRDSRDYQDGRATLYRNLYGPVQRTIRRTERAIIVESTGLDSARAA